MAGLVTTLLSTANLGGVTASAATTATTSNTATVFYYTKTRNWSSYNLHYAPDGGSWTTVPGVAMEAACTDWVKKTVDLGTAAGLQATFNNGTGTWDNNGGKNYDLGTGTVVVKDGVIAHSDPCGTDNGTGTSSPSPTPTPSSTTATVYYYTKTRNWSAYDLHYAPDGGSWTTVPGVAMEAACTDWVKKTVDLGTAAGLQATFNNGTGTWDNNGGKNYALGTGTVTVKDGVIGSADPCAGATASPSPSPSASASPTPSASPSASASASASVTPSASASPTASGNSATVFYSTAVVNWSIVNLHYAPAGAAWTAVPGIGMDAACPGWFKKTVSLGTASTMAATFNNGNGTWDNNNGANYVVAAGTSTVQNGKVTANAADPCAAVVPDTTAPSVPGGVAASATDTSIVLTWNPSTDDTGVTGYQVSRSGGTKGSMVYNLGSTVYSDAGLEPNTAYTYTVKALDAAGNVSAASAAATATTGSAPPPATQGQILGTDPRKDPIYFVLTARFYDGDSSNNRGGSQDVKSGNAANNDPMFRGDFKGLVQKLDYIKGLGFSAIWITPVVLNRSDYDYHGYHGWDFYKVDPRLESAGASYQDLINAAHAKNIKIYQDVVYNHSSRWGPRACTCRPSTASGTRSGPGTTTRRTTASSTTA
ncbi:hypothetical protein GCM10025734_72430 [Kitasatospora paranensis]